MSPHLHPKLACLWAAITLCTLVLVWLTRRDRVVYFWYFTAAAVQNLVMWWGVFHVQYWRAYYVTFIVLNFLGHALVVAGALNFGFDIGKRLKRLPESFPFMATAVMVTIISTGLLAACWRDGGASQSQVLWADHAVQMAVCGLVAIMLLLASFGGIARKEGLRRFLEGACALYLFGVIAAGLRVYRPVDREVGWTVDMFAQLAACGWWIHSMWNNSSTGGT